MRTIQTFAATEQFQEADKAKVTETLQLSVLLGPLLGPPLLDCPVPVGQHFWTNFDDAS